MLKLKGRMKKAAKPPGGGPFSLRYDAASVRGGCGRFHGRMRLMGQMGRTGFSHARPWRSRAVRLRPPMSDLCFKKNKYSPTHEAKLQGTNVQAPEKFQAGKFGQWGVLQKQTKGTKGESRVVGTACLKNRLKPSGTDP